MTNELTVSTPEEYAKHISMKLRVQSGAVFQLQAMESNEALHLISMMPEEGFKTKQELIKFVSEHLPELVEYVIKPCIVAPKVDKIAFLDVVDIIMKLMTQQGEEEKKANSFRHPKNSNKPGRTRKSISLQTKPNTGD